LEEERKEAHKWLDTIAKRAEEREYNIDFKSDIIEESISKVGSAIVDYAEHENIDLIVIGTRGRTGF
jgi:nucleotide-binding universal stress UspA family protein